MTRINAGIPTIDLSDKHLLAEHREIKRIPNMIKSGKAKINNIPDNFCLGKGHVKFFYNKLKYLHKRYDLIKKECIRRGFNITDFSQSFSELPSRLYNDWTPNEKDIKIIKKRINEKVKE